MRRLDVTYKVALLSDSEEDELQHAGNVTQMGNGSSTDEDTVNLVSTQLAEAVRALRQIEQGERVLHHLRGDAEEKRDMREMTVPEYERDYRPKP
jgi:hypothetical protein